ncbi:MAG: nucleotidyltransferase family protein [Lachnospiraceae bacterium]|nr:nucleotidyltransferase family protein [Lachnospiraceae bacterium]
MKVCGIIMECSPLHNGHAYLIDEAKKRTGADHVVVVMSGDFTQRGIPAVIDSHSRAEALLSCGVDLVLELPVYFATSAAGYFARGGVSLLSHLGVVTDLAFGSECGDLDKLRSYSELLSSEDSSFGIELRKCIRSGLSFPAARNKALGGFLPDLPNDVLGAEYLRWIAESCSQIRPCAIKRTECSHASDIRSEIDKNSCALESIKSYLGKTCPSRMTELLLSALGVSAPVTADDLSAPLYYYLMNPGPDGALSSSDYNDQLSAFFGVGTGLSRRIMNDRSTYMSFSERCSRLKSRNMTWTAVSRALLHITLGMTKERFESYMNAGLTGYARVLGFRKDSAPLLTAIKVNADIPLITSVSKAAAVLDPVFKDMLNEEVRCSFIYDSIAAQKFSSGFPRTVRSEYEKELVII